MPSRFGVTVVCVCLHHRYLIDCQTPLETAVSSMTLASGEVEGSDVKMTFLKDKDMSSSGATSIPGLIGERLASPGHPRTAPRVESASGENFGD
ncbi:MAG: hypothetical protein ABS36_10695 [Acidobacteria bacterium SCN 69-37]|nr:MAG: hypothetical protein ABS36_10695 [Acidobacteria bacterium SCN 69-37]